MEIIDKIKQAGKHILLWRKIYNSLCRKCRQKLIKNAQSSAQKGEKVSQYQEENKKIVDSFCPKCKEMIKHYEVQFK